MEKGFLYNLLKEPAKHIPYGDKCYEPIKGGGLKYCPFWELVDEIPYDDNGFCHFLKRGDWEGAPVDGTESLGLLFDGIKECGINGGIMNIGEF
ncbi:hypothetical protein [Mesobacillus harenae]|uniref:hypothetical protein n=1 Tax=Mesobacillus harenae TaxID=2213203 RepID=UPI00157FF326|nr:hypothetical protein [Mesobacillus harenae]